MGENRLATRLRALAHEVPTEYPMQILAEACKDEGLPFLAKAVNGGIAWSRKIRSAESDSTIHDLERQASSPGWSWNDERYAFLKVIWENSNDPSARLIFADWLEERGEFEEAEKQRQEADALVKAGVRT